MTEKKTFKNPDFIAGYSGATQAHWEVHNKTPDEPALGTFARSEWDMEVTFTKKGPQFRVGQRVRNKYVSAYVMTVLAQYKDQVVTVVESDDDIEIFDADDLVISL